MIVPSSTPTPLTSVLLEPQRAQPANGIIVNQLYDWLRSSERRLQCQAGGPLLGTTDTTTFKHVALMPALLGTSLPILTSSDLIGISQWYV